MESRVQPLQEPPQSQHGINMTIVTARCEEDLATGGFLMWPNGVIKAPATSS